jgi:hypothetical protein
VPIEPPPATAGTDAAAAPAGVVPPAPVAAAPVGAAATFPAAPLAAGVVLAVADGATDGAPPGSEITTVTGEAGEVGTVPADDDDAPPEAAGIAEATGAEVSGADPAGTVEAAGIEPAPELTGALGEPDGATSAATTPSTGRVVPGGSGCGLAHGRSG